MRSVETRLLTWVRLEMAPGTTSSLGRLSVRMRPARSVPGVPAGMSRVATKTLASSFPIDEPLLLPFLASIVMKSAATRASPRAIALFRARKLRFIWSPSPFSFDSSFASARHRARHRSREDREAEEADRVRRRPRKRRVRTGCRAPPAGSGRPWHVGGRVRERSHRVRSPGKPRHDLGSPPDAYGFGERLVVRPGDPGVDDREDKREKEGQHEDRLDQCLATLPLTLSSAFDNVPPPARSRGQASPPFRRPLLP